MSVTSVPSEKASGYPGLDAITADVRKDAMFLISKLRMGDILLVPAGTIKTKPRGYCRIDRQPPPSGGANIQVQLNGMSGDSSIATCVVSASVIKSLAKRLPGLREHQEGWLLRKIRIALTKSIDDGYIYHINGSFEDEDTPVNLTPRKNDAYRNRGRTNSYYWTESMK